VVSRARLTVGGTLAVALIALVLPTAAFASQLIDRNASQISLAVNRKGEALIAYRAGRQVRHVLAWGAVDARLPSESVPQVRFRLDYAGGWGKYHRGRYWRAFRDTCARYSGPALPFFVTGCTAPDGSYWALQRWQTALPDLGFTPWLRLDAASQLHLSHWSGPVAKIEVWNNWVWSYRYQSFFGRLTYNQHPVYGFGTTHYGSPTDGYGRLLYLDTFNSVYGKGWRRENSFVAHNPTGVFCYGFYRFDPTKNGYKTPPHYSGGLRGPGTGRRYRLTAEGPGVTPDVSVAWPGLHPYDPRSERDRQLAASQVQVLRLVLGVDKLCGRGVDFSAGP
jgi:hypothetical protein